MGNMSQYGERYVCNPENFTRAHIASKEEKDKIDVEDTFANLITELGGRGDKGTAGDFEQTRALRYDFPQLSALYRENWIAGSIVDAVPDDMTRTWRRLTNDEIPPDKIIEWEDMEKALEIRENFNFASKMARLYGGALLILSIDGTGPPDTPLDINQVRKGSLSHMNVVDLTRASHVHVVDYNPLSKTYGQPDSYYLHEIGMKVHSSRCIRFDGIRLPFYEYRRNNYWHDSVLNRIYDPLANMQTVVDTIKGIVYESNIDVLKIPDMMRYLQSPEQTKILTRRLQMQKLLKATTNTTVLDKEEEYANIVKQFTGLPSVLDRYLLMVTASSDVPAGRLLGDSASGFDISGSGLDLKNYYDGITAKQKINYNPLVEFLDQILVRHIGWFSRWDIEFEWNSLFQKDPEEEARAEKARAEVYSLLLNNEIITPSIVAKDLQNNPYFENITKEYVEKLEKNDAFMADIKERKEELELEMMENNLKTMNEEKESGTDKGTGKDGAPDPKKQVRNMKTPEGSKDIKDKNKEARSRGTGENK